MDVDWPQLLQNYGPFALLPFAVVVIERIAAKRARDQKLPEKIRNSIYASAWILIFALCIAVVAFWFQNRPKPQEAMMRGRITGLGIRRQLRASGPDTANVRVFTYRDPNEPDRLFWRAFSVNPLDDHTELSFYIDPTNSPNSENTYSFPFVANKNFYDYSTELVFKYDSTDNTIVFDNPITRSPQKLVGRPVVVRNGDPLPFAGPEFALARLPGFDVLFAQTRPAQTQVRLPPSAVIANLDSDDALVRLSARKQLASLGTQATPEMDKALVSADSSYRVKLGVIVAAIQMPAFGPGSFSPAAWCQVWTASQTGDDTLKTQASVLLKKQRTPVNLASCSARRPAVRPGVRPPAPEVVLPPVPDIVLLDSSNIDTVFNNPPLQPTFAISKRHLITYIWDYHWNDGRGKTAGTIRLRNDKGQMFGPWQAYGSAGQGGAPNVNWEAIANSEIPPGKYTVIDSDPGTWSWNGKSGRSGFSRVKGRPLE
jgi:hypothetical protein